MSCQPIGNSRPLKLTRREIRLLKDLIANGQRTYTLARPPSSIEVAHLIRAQYIVKLPPKRAVAKQYAVTQRGRQAVRIAKRGKPETPRARMWVSIEPGYTVLDGGPSKLVVKYDGKVVSF